MNKKSSKKTQFLLFGLCTFISTYVAYPQMKKFMIDPYYSDTEPEPEDGDNYYDDEPKLGKKGGYGSDDGEYYDGGEYKTDENEYKPDNYKKNG